MELDLGDILTTIGYVVGAGGLYQFYRSWLSHRRKTRLFVAQEGMTLQQYIECKLKEIMAERQSRIDIQENKITELHDLIDKEKDEKLKLKELLFKMESELIILKNNKPNKETQIMLPTENLDEAS